MMKLILVPVLAIVILAHTQPRARAQTCPLPGEPGYLTVYCAERENARARSYVEAQRRAAYDRRQQMQDDLGRALTRRFCDVLPGGIFAGIGCR